MATLLLSMLAALAVVQVVAVAVHRRAARLADARADTAAAVERIGYYDELLTMSARLAASSGDTRYVDRYRQAAPELDALMAGTVASVADPQVAAAVSDTMAVNTELVALQERSFVELAAGRPQLAYDLVTDEGYRAKRVRYDEARRRVLARTDDLAAAAAAGARRVENAVAALDLGAVGALGGLWAWTTVGLDRQRGAARRGEMRSRAIVAGTGEAFIELDLTGRVREWNATAEQMFGHPAADAFGVPLVDLVGPADRRAEWLGVLDAARCGQRPPRAELLACRTDGSTLPVDLSIWRAPDSSLGLFVHDSSPRKRMERRLREQATHDPLTRLANRRSFRQALGTMLATDSELCVLLAGLDRFKLVNDFHGHTDGDRLLLEVSDRLRAILLPHADAVLARLGGDEFAVAVPGISVAAAEALAESLVRGLAEPYAAAPAIAISASVGLVVLPQRPRGDVADAATVLRAADLAMYAAKSAGRRRWARYQPTMHEAMVQRVGVEAELRAGLARGELVVHYQPTFDLRSGQPIGAEALVRWNHPQQGLLAPDTFIPVAEQSDLIVELGRFVLTESCRQVAAWDVELGSAAPSEVSVNISPRQLVWPGFAGEVVGVLAGHGLRASQLVLEVTETSVMGDVPAAGATLEDLRALGVRIAIDDFGTGHSSLSRLRDLPADIVKIDRSFLREATAGKGGAVLSALMAMAEAVGLAVIAEGVETRAQRTQLLGLGCEIGQGYLFQRPAGAEAIGAVFAAAGTPWSRRTRPATGRPVCGPASCSCGPGRGCARPPAGR